MATRKKKSIKVKFKKCKHKNGLINEQLYRFAWGNNEKRATIKDRVCRILASGNKNTVMVQFMDNDQFEIVSRRALRRILKWKK